jgi:preprotein translocase subunit SecB
MEQQQHKLELISFDIIKVLFERKNLNKDFEYNINVKSGVDDLPKDGDVDMFKTTFLLSLSNEDENVPSIQVEAIGIFKMYGNPPKEVVYNFKQISSLSIIYPYIRAFVSNLTLQSGLSPIITPTINFIALAEQNKQVDKN